MERSLKSFNITRNPSKPSMRLSWLPGRGLYHFKKTRHAKSFFRVSDLYTKARGMGIHENEKGAHQKFIEAGLINS